ncbi:glycosyltransferase [Methylophilaceae bacterium Uisw_097]
MAPHISIIMPVFNSESFIEESISSVLNQSYTNFTLIIINDGSTDSSMSIVNKFTDSRIKIFSIKNSGVSAARNYGIKKITHTDFIAFIDSDDIWNFKKLEKQVSFFSKLPSKKNLIFSARRNFTDKNKIIGNYVYIKLFQDDSANLFVYDYITTSSVMLNYSAIFKKMNIFNVDFNGTEDWFAWLNLVHLKNYNIKYIDDFLVDYRISPISLSSNKTRHFDEELKVISRLSEFNCNINIIKLSHLHLSIRKLVFSVVNLRFRTTFFIFCEIIKKRYLINPLIKKYLSFLILMKLKK